MFHLSSHFVYPPRVSKRLLLFAVLLRIIIITIAIIIINLDSVTNRERSSPRADTTVTSCWFFVSLQFRPKKRIGLGHTNDNGLTEPRYLKAKFVSVV